MKKWIFLILSFVILGACEEKTQVERTEQPFEAPLPLKVEGEDGKYTEWYPGRKQIKVSGRKNKNGKRIGIWKYYSQEGVELSVTVYTNGVKDGHTVVKHPNGALHYIGEYKNGEKIGEWKFYDEHGHLTKEENFSEE